MFIIELKDLSPLVFSCPPLLPGLAFSEIHCALSVKETILDSRTFGSCWIVLTVMTQNWKIYQVIFPEIYFSFF